MSNTKIGFIGTGNIATAIFSGIVSSGYIKPQNVFVFDLDTSKVKPFLDEGANSANSAVDTVNVCDYVFLTVKPQVYEVVLTEIKDSVNEDVCFIDVAAGISIDYVKSVLGYNASVVRVMPNTPLMYMNGATALVHTEPVTDEQFSFVKGCFDACGISRVVDEDKINTVTAVSGSAPAYVMRFAKNLIDFAVGNGIDCESAEKLVIQTIIGSAEMVIKSNDSISKLIKKVTSPNGTTEAGLKSLNNDNFESVLKNCLEATVNRAEELSK